jgi:ADP-ribose pyrophosphatase YjhB (NUDIX family)
MTLLNPNASAYADKVRLRVCGICLKEDKLLLVRHQATVRNQAFWAPPGGGLEFGETTAACIRREVLEETGLQTEVSRFLFVNEFMEPPLQAVELFFELNLTGGEMVKGINKIPLQDKHRVLHYLFSLDDLLGMPHHFLK